MTTEGQNLMASFLLVTVAHVQVAVNTDQNSQCPLTGYCFKNNCPAATREGKWSLPDLAPGTQDPASLTILVYQNVSAKVCCQACKDPTSKNLFNTNGAAQTCAYWIQVPNDYAPCSDSGGGTGQGNCGRCYIYPEGTIPVCDPTIPDEFKSTIGRKCAYAVNDPHFMGAHGTRFEFNGEPEKSFCLITQENLHLNMKMSGFYDTRTEGASIMKDGKALRTWIREIGLTWRDESNKKHTFSMAARAGKEQLRKEGFLASATADGETLPRMSLGENKTLAGDLVLTFVGYEKSGAFDIDAYNIAIPGLLELDVKLRIAHPQLQTPDDAQTHINLGFNYVRDSASIHGIMGQTYREGREKKARTYNALSSALHRPIAADGKSGLGFLDGLVKDYVTSSVFATDCRYTVFNKDSLPGTA